MSAEKGFRLKMGFFFFFFFNGFSVKGGAVKVEFWVEGFLVEGEFCFFLLGFRLKVGFRWKGLSAKGEFLVEWVFV